MVGQAYEPRFSYGEIEGTLRSELAIVEGGKDSSSRRKASRGVLYFTLDLVERMENKEELDQLVQKLQEGGYPG